jgi:hypothetical protein
VNGAIAATDGDGLGFVQNTHPGSPTTLNCTQSYCAQYKLQAGERTNVR